MANARTTGIILCAMATACMARGASAQSLADIEAANEQLVRAFFAEAATDLDYLRDFLADDVVFTYEDTVVEGRDALIARSAPKMAALASYAIAPRRILVVGNTALTDRVDTASLEDGTQIALNVTATFLSDGGKIVEWREYPRPEAPQ